MITLYQFAPLWGLPNVSPFCLKLEAYLRLTNLKYNIKVIGDPRKAPKGKAPFISDDGKVIADSGFVIQYLKEKYGDPLDGHLNQVRQADSLAWQRLFEEHLYWVSLYARWIDDRNWPKVKADYFQRVNSLMRSFVANRVRKNMMAELQGHGMGRHSRDEIYQLGIDDLKALQAVLTAQPFIAGDVITSIDATGYAFLTNIIDVPIESPLKDYAASVPCFRHYCDLMKEQCGF